MRFRFYLALAAASCCASLASAGLSAEPAGGSAAPATLAAPSIFSQFGSERPADTLAPECHILPVQWLEPVSGGQPAAAPVATGYFGGLGERLFSGRATNNAWRANCDDCPTHGATVFVGYDAWRGVSSDSWENNGIHTGVNYGTRLGEFSELTGIGFQVGGSIGVYNWSGRDSDYPQVNNNAETQGFLTFGFFRKQNDQSNWSAALVQDWMFNNNFGAFSENPTISQWRGQLGYAISAWNEFGMWGAWQCTTASANIAGVGPTRWRAVNQLDAFWHHKWQRGGGDTWLYVGAPLGTRLNGDGTLGSYIASAYATVPLSTGVSLYTLVTYMRPSDRPSSAAADEDFWNFTIGLAYYTRRNARSNTVAGQCWMPQLPVANNGFFMVDTNNH